MLPLRKREGVENKAVRLTNYLRRLPPRWVPFILSTLLSYIAFPSQFSILLIGAVISLARESLSYAYFFQIILFTIGGILPIPLPHIILSWAILLTLLYLSLAFSPSTLSLAIPPLVFSYLHYDPILTVAAWALALLFFLFFSFLLNRPAMLFLGMPLPKLLSAFLKSWLLKGKELEEELSRFSTLTDVEVEIIELTDEDEKVELTIPYIHFGPFGNIGSGRFPALAYSKDRIVFHGTANHQLDFVKEEEAKALAQSLVKAKTVTTSEKVGFGQEKVGKGRAFLLDFGSFSLAFLTRAPHTTEDITYGGGLRIRMSRPTPTAVVDLHNSEASTITYFDELSQEVVEYAEAVKKAEAKNQNIFYFTHGVTPSISPAVGGGGIHILLLKKKGDPPLAVVVIDSNGIRKECKEAIEKIGKRKGWMVLVATTDTHEKNVGRGVINDYQCEDTREIEKLLNRLEEKLKEKIKGKKKAKATLKKLIFSAYVVGSRKVVESLSVILDSYSIARALLPFLLLMDAAILYVLHLI